MLAKYLAKIALCPGKYPQAVGTYLPAHLSLQVGKLTRSPAGLGLLTVTVTHHQNFLRRYLCCQTLFSSNFQNNLFARLRDSLRDGFTNPSLRLLRLIATIAIFSAVYLLTSRQQWPLPSVRSLHPKSPTGIHRFACSITPSARSASYINIDLPLSIDCAALSKIPPTPLRHPQIMNKTPPSKQIWNPAFKQI